MSGAPLPLKAWSLPARGEANGSRQEKQAFLTRRGAGLSLHPACPVPAAPIPRLPYSPGFPGERGEATPRNHTDVETWTRAEDRHGGQRTGAGDS